MIEDQIDENDYEDDYDFEDEVPGSYDYPEEDISEDINDKLEIEKSELKEPETEEPGIEEPETEEPELGKPETETPETEEQITEEPDISNSEYIEMKRKEYFRQEDATEKEWYQLRAQINSGLYLGIKKSNIDIYAKSKYTYEQREILKYYIYDRTDAGIINNALAYSASEMKVYLASSKTNNNLIDAINSNVAVLDDNIKRYREDFSSVIKELEVKIEKYKNRINELEKKIEEKDIIISKERDKYQNLLNNQAAAHAEKEKKSKYERDVEAAATRIYNERRIQEEIERKKQLELEERIAAKIRQEYGITEPRRKFNFFGKKKNINDINIPISMYESSDEFDLTSYMMKADLSSSQYDVLSLAVRAKIDDNTIKQMIDKNLSANQMKQLISVILTKREIQEKESSADREAEDCDSYDNDNSDYEEDVHYED